MKLNSGTCQAYVTINDGVLDGPLTHQCDLQPGHEGPHEILYKEPRSGGLKVDISWYDLAPQPVEALSKIKPRPRGPEQEPFRAKHYPVKRN